MIDESMTTSDIYEMHAEPIARAFAKQMDASMSVPCGRCSLLTDPADLDQCLGCRGFEICPKCMIEHDCDVRKAQR